MSNIYRRVVLGNAGRARSLREGKEWVQISCLEDDDLVSLTYFDSDPVLSQNFRGGKRI